MIAYKLSGRFGRSSIGDRVRAEPLLPGPLPLFHHQLPQRLIDSCLIAPPYLFEPGQNVGIQTQRDRHLERPVQPCKFRRQVGRTLSSPGSLETGNPSTLRNSFTLFHLAMKSSYLRTYNITSTMFHVEHSAQISARNWVWGGRPRPPSGSEKATAGSPEPTLTSGGRATPA